MTKLSEAGVCRVLQGDDFRNGIAEGVDVACLKRTDGLDDERARGRKKDRLDDGRPKQPGGLPLGDDHLTSVPSVPGPVILLFW